MSSIQHDKLVRDKIPEVIVASGKHPVIDIFTEQEMETALER